MKILLLSDTVSVLYCVKYGVYSKWCKGASVCVFYQIFLETSGKFTDTIRTTQKAGRLCRTLLTYLTVIVSQWEVTRHIEQEN